MHGKARGKSPGCGSDQPWGASRPVQGQGCRNEDVQYRKSDRLRLEVGRGVSGIAKPLFLPAQVERPRRKYAGVSDRLRAQETTAIGQAGSGLQSRSPERGGMAAKSATIFLILLCFLLRPADTVQNGRTWRKWRGHRGCYWFGAPPSALYPGQAGMPTLPKAGAVRAGQTRSKPAQGLPPLAALWAGKNA